MCILSSFIETGSQGSAFSPHTVHRIFGYSIPQPCGGPPPPPRVNSFFIHTCVPVFVQLMLAMYTWNQGSWEWCDEIPDARILQHLWSMGKNLRILLWKQLARESHWENLALGGEMNTQRGVMCPFDTEELKVLFPVENLRNLKQLHLCSAGRLDDEALGCLASAGCGAQLMSLSLQGKCLQQVPSRRVPQSGPRSPWCCSISLPHPSCGVIPQRCKMCPIRGSSTLHMLDVEHIWSAFFS